jgi:exodeoxyribonuclease VII large subunit
LLDSLRTRPVLADPRTPLMRRAEQIATLRDRGRRAVLGLLAAERSSIDSTNARLTTLGPAATLARGYAVVQRVDQAGKPGVLRSIDEAPDGTRLRVRVMDGAVHATVSGREAAASGEPGSSERR